MKRFIIIKDSDLTQEILNCTCKFSTKYLRWNQNKSVLTPKKYIIDFRSGVPEVLISYYPYTYEEIKLVLTESEWQDIEV